MQVLLKQLLISSAIVGVISSSAMAVPATPEASPVVPQIITPPAGAPGGKPGVAPQDPKMLGVPVPVKPSEARPPMSADPALEEKALFAGAGALAEEQSALDAKKAAERAARKEAADETKAVMKAGESMLSEEVLAGAPPPPKMPKSKPAQPSPMHPSLMDLQSLIQGAAKNMSDSQGSFTTPFSAGLMKAMQDSRTALDNLSTALSKNENLHDIIDSAVLDLFNKKVASTSAAVTNLSAKSSLSMPDAFINFAKQLPADIGKLKTDIQVMLDEADKNRKAVIDALDQSFEVAQKINVAPSVGLKKFKDALSAEMNTIQLGVNKTLDVMLTDVSNTNALFDVFVGQKEAAGNLSVLNKQLVGEGKDIGSVQRSMLAPQPSKPSLDLDEVNSHVASLGRDLEKLLKAPGIQKAPIQAAFNPMIEALKNGIASADAKSIENAINTFLQTPIMASKNPFFDDFRKKVVERKNDIFKEFENYKKQVELYEGAQKATTGLSQSVMDTNKKLEEGLKGLQTAIDTVFIKAMAQFDAMPGYMKDLVHFGLYLDPAMSPARAFYMSAAVATPEKYAMPADASREGANTPARILLFADPKVYLALDFPMGKAINEVGDTGPQAVDVMQVSQALADLINQMNIMDLVRLYAKLAAMPKDPKRDAMMEHVKGRMIGNVPGRVAKFQSEDVKNLMAKLSAGMAKEEIKVGFTAGASAAMEKAKAAREAAAAIPAQLPVVAPSAAPVVTTSSAGTLRSEAEIMESIKGGLYPDTKFTEAEFNRLSDDSKKKVMMMPKFADRRALWDKAKAREAAKPFNPTQD